MKFATLLVIFLTFSTISLDVCSVVSRAHRYRTARRTRAGIQNKWVQLFIAIIIGASGKGDAEVQSINTCIPPAWKVAEVGKIADDNAPAEPKSTWTTILDGIEKVLGLVCGFKDKIKSFFARKVRRQMRRSRHRMYLQYSLATYRRTAGFFSDIGNKIKSAFNGAVDWVKKKWDDVKNFAKQVVDNIKMFWDNLKNKVKAFLNSDFIANIKKWIECLKTAAGVAKGIKDVVVGIIQRVTEISSIAAGNIPALAKLLIDLICNFSLFRQAFSTLADAVQEKTDMIKRYAGIGRFIGLLIRALATKLRQYL